MIFVHDGDARGVRAGETFEMESYDFGRTCFFWKKQVPGSDGERAVLAASDQGGVGIYIETSFAELMQEPKVVEGRFGDAALGEQAKATVERSFHHALFFEDV